VIKGTAQIISQSKDAILESESKSVKKNKKQSSLNSKLYSRFDAQIRAIQGDSDTYTEEPFDLERYNKWKLEFSLEGKKDEMEKLLRENDEMESVFRRLVPDVVDRETFWLRYYYKVYKVKKAEDVRAKLVKRMSREEEDDEELSWDVEDEEYEGDDFDDKRSSNVDEVDDFRGEESKSEKSNSLLQNKMMEESKVDENLEALQEKGDQSQVDKAKDSVAVSDKKVTMEKNVGDGNSEHEASQNSKQEQLGEKELEWDEIEDHSSNEQKKEMGLGSGSPSKIDLRKRLSSAAEEEDLSWDIEDDDDEPAKALDL